MSITSINDKHTKEPNPFTLASEALNVPPLTQANRVWAALTDLANESLTETEADQATALVQVGMQIIMIRDFVIASVARLEDDEATKYLLTMGTIVGSAPRALQSHLAASAAMLSAAFGFDRQVIEVFVDRAGDTNLGKLVKDGLLMRAPASLFRLSSAHCYESILKDLQATSQQ